VLTTISTALTIRLECHLKLNLNGAPGHRGLTVLVVVASGPTWLRRDGSDKLLEKHKTTRKTQQSNTCVVSKSGSLWRITTTTTLQGRATVGIFLAEIFPSATPTAHITVPTPNKVSVVARWWPHMSHYFNTPLNQAPDCKLGSGCSEISAPTGSNPTRLNNGSTIQS
jgi:YD repeat-containing protein